MTTRTATSARWQLIINPAAGAGRAARKRHAALTVLRNEGVEWDLYETGGSGEARGIARDRAVGGHRRFLIAGGDGTLNEAVNGLFDAGALNGATVAVLPLGSGNDWTRSRAYARDLRKVATALKRDRGVSCPVGLVQSIGTEPSWQRCFVNSVGIGLDVRVIESAPAVRWATLRYLVGLMRAFARFEAIELNAVIDGESSARQVLLALCALGPFAGGGMCLAPHARDLNGHLAVTEIEDLPWWRLTLSGYRLYNGSIEVRPEVHTRIADIVELSTRYAEPVQVDGEVVGRTAIRISILDTGLQTIDCS